MKFVQWISPIALCYAAGFIISALPIELHPGIVKNIAEVSIALSISLLVLNSQFSRFRSMIGSALKAFFLGILSLFISLVIAYYFMANHMENGPEILGMLTGVYVGGTPNLNAIALALEVPSDIIVLVNTSEIFYGGIYFLLLITVIKPFFSLFLRKYVPISSESMEHKEEEISLNLVSKISAIAKLLSLSTIILVISFGLSYLIYQQINIALFLISTTTLSVLAAQFNTVKILPLKFEVADFLLLIFSLGIGLQINPEKIFSSGAEIYLLVGSVFFGTIALHVLFSYLTKTDVDTMIISSTAALYGPPFIVPVAKAIKNNDIVFYGITLGLLGYVLGNYLGLGIAMLFTWLGS